MEITDRDINEQRAERGKSGGVCVFKRVLVPLISFQSLTSLEEEKEKEKNNIMNDL